jgi:uncharacterized NAD(P)/FAD-binding protein YdhS
MEGLETPCCSIAIVGGGCSGALVAVHLLRNGFQGRVTIIEPRERLGLGLAYSTPFDQHLLNVPADDMTALPAQRSHFLDWLRARHHRHARADSFAPRRLYGEYLNGLLQEATAGGADTRFSHIRAEAVGFGPDGKGARITLSNGTEVRAERVVLAVGNPTSSNVYSSARKGFEDSWHLSPWTDDALRVRFAGERILLWGTGLTAVDAAIALQSQEVNCKVYMVSRRGILPQVHKLRVPAGAPFCFRSRAGLGPRLREFRERIEAARNADLCWRTVIDSLRPISNSLWQTLPPEDQRRFLRHLKRYWEVHRHRMAPEIRARLNELGASSALQIVAGRLQKIHSSGGVNQVKISLKCGAERTLEADRIINCTGVNENYAESRRPSIRSLIENGLAQANHVGLGFSTDACGALLSPGMIPSSVFFTLGPPRVGQLLETTAVPEIRVQAENLAAHLIAAKG